MVTVCHCVGDGYGNPCAGCPARRPPYNRPYGPPVQPDPTWPYYPQPYTNPPPGDRPGVSDERLRRLIREEMDRLRDE